MATIAAGSMRPPLHMLAAESDMIASLALQAEHKHPVIASMLLEEIERAELHEPGTLPSTAVTIGSQVDFVDEKSCQLRKVELVLPAAAVPAHHRRPDRVRDEARAAVEHDLGLRLPHP